MVVVNVGYCVGCRRCERSCPINGIIFNEYPIKCMHCDKNPCLYACPENAIERIDDKVVVIKDKCIGCGLCAIACPFGAIRIDGTAIKCDGCYKRDVEICKEVCPTGAINKLEKILCDKLCNSVDRLNKLYNIYGGINK
ncbi:4Fe-4S dicluster domain-containing protein [Methanocaldococcus fervens]|nr:4Fe-4S dicluster domain-containing protein [Methanocaldococcus fervens]